MKIDRYTKIVLTVIAAALVLLVGQNIFEAKSVMASSSGVTKVAICNVKGEQCLNTYKTDKGEIWRLPASDFDKYN